MSPPTGGHPHTLPCGASSSHSQLRDTTDTYNETQKLITSPHYHISPKLLLLIEKKKYFTFLHFLLESLRDDQFL